MSISYVVRPRAERDLDDYADYLAIEASVDVARRFLSAARDTFALLATQPNMGWHFRLSSGRLEGARVFRIAGFEKVLVF